MRRQVQADFEASSGALLADIAGRPGPEPGSVPRVLGKNGDCRHRELTVPRCLVGLLIVFFRDRDAAAWQRLDRTAMVASIPDTSSSSAITSPCGRQAEPHVRSRGQMGVRSPSASASLSRISMAPTRLQFQQESIAGVLTIRPPDENESDRSRLRWALNGGVLSFRRAHLLRWRRPATSAANVHIWAARAPFPSSPLPRNNQIGHTVRA